ncbi:MAG: SSU ribosomal protein S7p (S5e), partial [uncultured Thermomicrobiales bacterium]
ASSRKGRPPASSPGPAVQQRTGVPVHQQGHAARQEGRRREDHVRGDGHHPVPHGSVADRGLRAGAVQRHAGPRGQAPPRRWCHLPGPGPDRGLASPVPGDPLADLFGPVPAGQDDGGQARQRAARRLQRHRRDDQAPGRHAPHGRSEPRVLALPLL